MLNQLWTARELRGQVVGVIPEADNAATLVIKPCWGWHFAYRRPRGGRRLIRWTTLRR
jgi:hypothetical protein